MASVPRPSGKDRPVIVCVVVDDCTLRAAIDEANDHAGLDMIVFDIGSGTPTISPAAGFGLGGPVVVDGNTGGATRIELDGSNAPPPARGLYVGSDCTVRGLVINGFRPAGLTCGCGIVLTGDNSKIESNYVGTAASGTSSEGDQGAGILIADGANNNTVGGTTDAQRNLISGHDGSGVIVETGASGNVIQGNYIGTDQSGTGDLGNDLRGVSLDGSNNTVGGTEEAARNVIAGNLIGVNLSGSGNLVRGNYIGPTKNGSAAPSGQENGVFATFGGGTSGPNTIAGNVISGNTLTAMAFLSHPTCLGKAAPVTRSWAIPSSTTRA